ncbi:HipA domain-containing protein [Nocardia sp. NPDC019395]|uniref:HipA domain-containing protein n=1 Tax=Nocardia sp. NPDC019395 TaxID=3154686 RepID=UPI003410DB56
MELDLWLGGRLVARTISRDRGAKVRIVYDDRVAAEVGGEVPLLSCSLPTPGPSAPAAARAFLEGLLPEGRALETAAAQVRGVRLRNGAPDAVSDTVLLLAAYGRECAGAVVAMPAGSAAPSPGRYAEVDEDGLAELVAAIPEHPLGADLSRDIRMSLAGAQPKLLLARIGDRWCEPVDGAPSTHILKPTGAWPHSARNEALVMTLAREIGLTDRPVWVEDVRGVGVLVAERYDRMTRTDGTVGRLHQEDMCQAVGLRPVDKYHISRPSKRMAKLLRQFTDSPGIELEGLFRQLAFRVIVGDEDGHGKNYSLLLNTGSVTLAPLYDCLCTLIYPELSGHMATPIGTQVTLAKVDRAALLDEAKAMGLPEAAARECLDELGSSLGTAIDTLDSGLTEGWPSDQVIGLIRTRLDRLESGRPLGAPREDSPRFRRTLDQATWRRSP